MIHIFLYEKTELKNNVIVSCFRGFSQVKKIPKNLKLDFQG